MWEKLGSGRKKLQDHPGLRVLVAVGLGMAIAVVTTLATPVAKMSNLINDLTTKVTKTEQASKIAKSPIIRPGPARSIRISYPPCLDSDLDCYVQFTAEDEVMVKLFTAATLTLIFTLPIFFALGHSRLQASMIRAKKVTYEFTISEDETFTCTTTYEGLLADEKRGELYIPCDFRYHLQPADSSSVQITSIRAVSLHEGVDAILDPPFDPVIHRQGYEGRVVFDPVRVAVERLEVTHTVTKNMCLNLSALRQRWGHDHPETDDYSVSSRCHWDELEIRFRWPPSFRLTGTPNVSLRKLVGAQRERLKFNNWHPASWVLSAKEVAPGAEFVFEWTLC